MRSKRTRYKRPRRLGFEACEPRWQLSAAAVFSTADFANAEFLSFEAGQPLEVATGVEAAEFLGIPESALPFFLSDGLPQAIPSAEGGSAFDVFIAPSQLIEIGEGTSSVVFELPPVALPGSAGGQVNRPVSSGAGAFTSIDDVVSAANAEARVEAVFDALAAENDAPFAPLIDAGIAETIEPPRLETADSSRAAPDLFEIAYPRASAGPTAAAHAGRLASEAGSTDEVDEGRETSLSPLGEDQSTTDGITVAAEDRMSDDLRRLASRVLVRLGETGQCNPAADSSPEPLPPVAVDLIRAAAGLLAPADAVDAIVRRPEVGRPIDRTHGVEEFDVFEAVLNEDRVVARIEREDASTASHALFSVAAAITAGLSLDRVRKARGKATREAVFSSALAEEETKPAVVGRVL